MGIIVDLIEDTKSTSLNTTSSTTHEQINNPGNKYNANINSKAKMVQ